MDLNQEDLQQMKDLYQKDGSTYTSVGKLFNLSRKVVARILKSEGVEPKEQVPAKIKGEEKTEAPVEAQAVSPEKKEAPKKEKKKSSFNRAVNPEKKDNFKKEDKAFVKLKQGMSVFLSRKVPDASKEFRQSVRSGFDIDFVGLKRGEFSNTCAYDASFETVHFFKSHHEMINWYRDHVKDALNGGWEDELHLIELYLGGKRLKPRFEMHVTLPLNKKVQQSLIFDHEYK